MDTMADFLKRSDIFNSLSDDDLEQVISLIHKVHFEAGQVIVNIHDPADHFFLVRSGRVQVSLPPADADEKPSGDNSVLLTLGEGQSFGEMGLVDRGTRSATVRADTASDLYQISCNAFLDLCERVPILGFRVMSNIAADLSFKLRHNIRA